MMSAESIKIGRWSIKLPPEPEFKEDGHRYTDPETGNPLESVTTIMRSCGMSHNWGSDEDKARGTKVHKAILYDLEGELADSPNSSWWGYVEADRAFREQYNWRSAIRERPIMQALYRYAGKPDDVGLITINGTELLAIRDLKSGTAPWWVYVQLVLYLLCFPDLHKFVRLGVELHQDGTFKIIGPWFAQTWEKDVQVGMAALKIHEARLRLK